jgi:adenosylcobinamide-phosphate synthase
MSTAVLVCAYAIDWIAGDPEWLPHPVRIIGKLITQGEALAKPGQRTPARDLWSGGFLVATVVGMTTVASGAALYAARRVDSRVAWMVEVLLAWTVLATGSLLTEARQVISALEVGDLVLARERLARIVGRDTTSLGESEIARAVIETLAESTCDGIVAPLCFLAAGGVPAALAYKAINTLDSMIGHRDPPYTYFGRIAARLDDVANFIPARFAAVAIAIAAGLTGKSAGGAFRVWWQDGARHDSPNAGHPEAAMAGALGIRLGGTNDYDGVPAPKPVLGAQGRLPTIASARQAYWIVAVASLASFVVTAFVARMWRS